MSVSFISGRTKDSVHLVYKDYRFSRDRTRNGTIYWRCMLSRRTPLNPTICKARISTDKDGNILSLGQEHNHLANKLEIQIRTCISDIKQLAELQHQTQLESTDREELVNLKELVLDLPPKLRSELNREKRRKKKSGQKHVQRSRSQEPVPLGHPESSSGGLSIGLSTQALPTFSLANLGNNERGSELMESVEVLNVTPALLPTNHFSPEVILTPPSKTATPQTSVEMDVARVPPPSQNLGSPAQTATATPTKTLLERELLSLLEEVGVEQLPALVPFLSQGSSLSGSSLSGLVQAHQIREQDKQFQHHGQLR